MSKAYLVSYSAGTYDTYIKVNHFVTFDKNKAEVYVEKFNRILEQYRNYFNDNDLDDESTMYYIYRTLDINCASFEKIEIR
jgi:hypothetical protein